MHIHHIDLIQIETPRYYGYVSGHLLVKVHTESGLIGLGEASDSRGTDLPTIAEQFKDLLVGRDARNITAINEVLQAHRFQESVSDHHLVSAIDLALLDLNGKAQSVPAYQLMGGKVRERIFCCYPIFGWQVREDFEEAAGYLKRLVDLGHHLFRYYISGDAALDDRFLTEMKTRFGEAIRLKSIDFSGRFNDWEPAVRYAEVLRHHDPYHFEQPSRDLRVSAEFVRRVDLHVSWHINTLRQGFDAIDHRACTAFNLACVASGPTNIRRIFALAEAAGIKCLIGTDQESTLGTAAQVAVGVSVPNLDLPCDPMGPVLYTTSPARHRIRSEASHLYPSDADGLGVELDEKKLAEMTIATASTKDTI